MHPERYLALAVVCAALTSAPQQRPLRAIGIVEVPRLFTDVASANGGFERRDSGARLLLRREPSADSPVVATISSLKGIDVAEFTYEEEGALAYGREREWSLLKTTDGSVGWLAPEDAGPFHSLETLLEGLPYLTDAWDGHLSASPGAARRARVPSDPRRRMIGYLVPQLEEVRVVLKPGEDPEEVRKRHGGGSMGSAPGPNGTRILYFDRAVWVQAFERPDRLASVAARFQTDRCNAALEATGGFPAQVMVFDRQPGWFQVALNREDWRESPRVWIEEAPVWRFHAVTAEAERERLAEEVWGREDSGVRVAGFRRVDDTLWVDVEVLSHSPCRSGDQPTVTARGWIAAHDSSGAPTIWFSSRGC
jgi:hypothetical protein